MRLIAVLQELHKVIGGVQREPARSGTWAEPLYTRVSTDEQKTDLQLMDLKEYVQKRAVYYI
jgi:hypothetical protein